MNSVRTPFILQLICSVFIFLFAYTALSKLQQYHQFVSVLLKSPLIGSISEAVAWIIPTIELIIAGLLFFPRTRRPGLYGSSLLMIVFTVYLGYMILFTPHLPCTCGGVIQKMTWKQHLLFNLALTAISLSGIIIDSKHPYPRKQPKEEYSIEAR